VVRVAKKQVDPALANRVPPGQTLTAKWPVLTYGLTPRFDPARWTFRCMGLVEREMTWTWPEFSTGFAGDGSLPMSTASTRWSKLDNVWEGVSIREIVSRVKPRRRRRSSCSTPIRTTRPTSRWPTWSTPTCCWRSSTTAANLEPDHGGPMRLVVPKL